MPLSVTFSYWFHTINYRYHALNQFSLPKALEIPDQVSTTPAALTQIFLTKFQIQNSKSLLTFTSFH